VNAGVVVYDHVVGLSRRWRARLWVAVLALLADGMVEGVGILLLLPLLAVVGIDVGQGAVGRLSSLVAAAFRVFAIPPSLPVVLGMFVAVSVIVAMLRRATWILSSSLEQAVARASAGSLYDAIVRMDWTRFTRMRAADLTVALTVECDRMGQAASVLLNICGSTIVAIVYVAVAARVSALMTIIVLACAAVVARLLGRRTKRTGALGAAFAAARREFAAAVTDDLGGMKTIRSSAAEERSTRRIGRLASELCAAQAASIRHHANLMLLLDIGSAITLSGLLLVAIKVMHFDAAAILMLLFLFARVVPRVGKLQEMMHAYVNVLPAVERVAALEAQCREAGAPDRRSAGPLPLRRHLRFEGVSFRYAPEEPPVLNGVDLTVDAGTTVAIVGASGVGKTTLVDLMIGLLAPQAGRIIVDDTALAENAAGWRETIGYVPQDPFLFHDTIRANLAWARPEASTADVDRALKLARAEFVHDLPGGLDTVVGDRGTRLSGGERQRIALARALLREPSLLILDEATSSIDLENERRILEAISGLHGSVTIVMITHRLAAVAGVDATHVLEGGRVVAPGVPA
jgi:ATP-binding cassette subfamily C protein